LSLTPVLPMTLERAIEFIRDDEQGGSDAESRSVCERTSCRPINDLRPLPFESPDPFETSLRDFPPEFRGTAAC
jgi:hypothetical protein